MEQVKQYLQLCLEKNTVLSVEGFVIWLMENDNKTFSEASTYAGEYRGYINTYAIAYLKEKAATGGRNSQTYLQLLKEYTESETSSNGVIEAVNITIDIPEGKQEAKVVYEDKGEASA